MKGISLEVKIYGSKSMSLEGCGVKRFFCPIHFCCKRVELDDLVVFAPNGLAALVALALLCHAPTLGDHIHMAIRTLEPATSLRPKRTHDLHPLHFGQFQRVVLNRHEHLKRIKKSVNFLPFEWIQGIWGQQEWFTKLLSETSFHGLYKL